VDRFVTVRTNNPRAAKFPNKADEERTWTRGLIVDQTRQLQGSLQRSKNSERVAIEFDTCTRRLLGRSLTSELVRDTTGLVAAMTAGPFIDLAT
jgi:hypothetical protein